MALNLTELSGYLTSLGPLPATSSCGSYPVCSIEMIGRGVQTGRLHRDHLLTMVHPVDECYNMLARICTCGSPCWNTRATSVEAAVQLNNTILLNFSGPILPMVPYTNGSHVGMLTVAFYQPVPLTVAQGDGQFLPIIKGPMVKQNIQVFQGRVTPAEVPLCFYSLRYGFAPP